MSRWFPLFFGLGGANACAAVFRLSRGLARIKLMAKGAFRINKWKGGEGSAYVL